MSEMLESPLFIPSLLGVLIVLQLLVFAVLIRLSSKVSQLSRNAGDMVPPVGQDLADRKEGNAEQKQLFAEFLAEDPARRELPKKEQFAAFRRWRDEKGLNWKNPANSA